MRRRALSACFVGGVGRLRFFGWPERRRATGSIRRGGGRYGELEGRERDLHHRNLDRRGIFSIQTAGRLRSRRPESCLRGD